MEKPQLFVQEVRLAEWSRRQEEPSLARAAGCAAALQRSPRQLPGESFYYSFPGLEMWSIKPHHP